VKLLKAGGYATDPNYVSKLLNIIDRFNLTQYDKGINPAVWN
jgi:flagellum-specific peptidoglycan hydrolase FlgJ